MVTLGIEGRRWEIFQSAVYAFAEQGYENVSMRELAEQNNMRAASLYYHFDSKEALLELMYDFYSANITDNLPDLEMLLEQVSHGKPVAVLQQCMSYLSEELQPLMNSVFVTAMAQANRDQRAYDLIYKNTFEYAQTYVGAVLNKMVAEGKIEPLDVESFINLYTSLLFRAEMYGRARDPLSPSAIQKSLQMLYTLVKEK